MVRVWIEDLARLFLSYFGWDPTSCLLLSLSFPLESIAALSSARLLLSQCCVPAQTNSRALLSSQATRPFLSRRPTQAPVAGSTNTLSTFPSFFRKAHCDDDDDDDEPVDMMPTLREQCKPNCMKEFGLYEKCGERVTEKGSGDCEAVSTW